VISVQAIVSSLESLQIRWNHNQLKSLNFFFGQVLSAVGTYQLPQVIRKEQRTLHHDDFGMTQSKLITVINSKSLERNVGGKPVSTFLHTVLENSDRCFQMTNH
jgi:hypothetical protein